MDFKKIAILGAGGALGATFIGGIAAKFLPASVTGSKFGAFAVTAACTGLGVMVAAKVVK